MHSYECNHNFFSPVRPEMPLLFSIENMGAKDTFIDGLRALMEQHNLSVLEMNEKFGVSRSWLTPMLRGEKDPGIEWADELLLRAFGVSLGFVLSQEKVVPPSIPSDFRDLYRKLPLAIQSAIDTGTQKEFRYALTLVINDAIKKKAEAKKALRLQRARESPRPSHREGGEEGTAGPAAGRRETQTKRKA